VDISTALSFDLKNLLRILDLPDLDIERSLRALRYDIAVVVPSFVGLSMTLVVEGQPVTLTSMGEEATTVAIGSSLALPLSLTSGLAEGSSLVCYATAPGAFVDLAADLGYALSASDGEVLLDQHLTPASTRSGIAGVEELSLVNRALGVLIGRGLTPEDAHDQLRRRADATGLQVVQVAAFLVGSTE
jgi:hypothetical protein